MCKEVCQVENDEVEVEIMDAINTWVLAQVISDLPSDDE